MSLIPDTLRKQIDAYLKDSYGFPPEFVSWVRRQLQAVGGTLRILGTATTSPTIDPATELQFETGDPVFPDGGFLLVDNGDGRARVYNNAPLFNRTNVAPHTDPAQYFDLETFNTITSPQLYAKFLMNSLGLVKLEGKGSTGTAAIFLDPDAGTAPAGIYMSVNAATHEIRNVLGAANSKFEVLDHNGNPILTLTG